jgi:hypothetical protein
MMAKKRGEVNTEEDQISWPNGQWRLFQMDCLPMQTYAIKPV